MDVCFTEQIQYDNVTHRKRIFWNVRNSLCPSCGSNYHRRSPSASWESRVEGTLIIQPPPISSEWVTGTPAVRVGSGIWETVVQRDRSLDMISRGVTQVLNNKRGDTVVRYNSETNKVVRPKGNTIK